MNNVNIINGDGSALLDSDQARISNEFICMEKKE